MPFPILMPTGRPVSAAMHTYMYRLNALFTVASTALAVICAAAALTDWTFTPDPSVDLKVKSYDGLQVSSVACEVHILTAQICLNIFNELLCGAPKGSRIPLCSQREAGEHRAWMTMQLKADLGSLFHWNTKQVPWQHGFMCHFSPEGVSTCVANFFIPPWLSCAGLRIHHSRV